MKAESMYFALAVIAPIVFGLVLRDKHLRIKLSVVAAVVFMVCSLNEAALRDKSRHLDDGWVFIFSVMLAGSKIALYAAVVSWLVRPLIGAIVGLVFIKKVKS